MTRAERRQLVTAVACFVSLMFVTAFAAQAAPAQNFQVLHTFTGGADGSNPAAGLTFDRAGNLYGTAETGGNSACFPYGCGVVWEITP